MQQYNLIYWQRNSTYGLYQSTKTCRLHINTCRAYKNNFLLKFNLEIHIYFFSALCRLHTLWGTMQYVQCQRLMNFILAVDYNGKQVSPLGGLFNHLRDGTLLRNDCHQCCYWLCSQLPVNKLSISPTRNKSNTHVS